MALIVDTKAQSPTIFHHIHHWIYCHLAETEKRANLNILVPFFGSGATLARCYVNLRRFTRFIGGMFFLMQKVFGAKIYVFFPCLRHLSPVVIMFIIALIILVILMTIVTNLQKVPV